MSYARYHDELASLMSRYRGKTFSNKQITTLFSEAYPHLNVGWVQASDHCIDHTCKGACDCALTERAIFSRPKHNTYIVRQAGFDIRVSEQSDLGSEGDGLTFFVNGLPGTYATRKEVPWKNAVYRQAPRPSLGGREIGLRLRFTLPTLTPWGQPLDVDNLCEPVFSVLINRLGWFDGSRSNLQWWQATKEAGSNTGCRITVDTSESVILPKSEPDYDHVYTGQLPRNARFRPLGDWARNIRQQNHIRWIPQLCSLYLSFTGTDYNIGNISNDSIVKPTIDCLYPWLGGQEGSPDDHRIMNLAVSKSRVSQPSGAVVIKLWAHGREDGPQPARPGQSTLSEAAQSTETVKTSKSAAGMITNPCIPGTRKWIVCEGALAKKTVGQVQSDLERAYQGSGRRIREYISDLRSENRLDIRIEGGQLVCRGRLS